MTEITYSGNQLSIGENVIKLDHKIKEIIIRDDIVVVLQKIPPNEKDSPKIDRNVVAFDTDGNQIWTIDSPPHGKGGQPYKYFIDRNDEKILISNWNENRYELDIHTGELSNERYEGK